MLVQCEKLSNVQYKQKCTSNNCRFYSSMAKAKDVQNAKHIKMILQNLKAICGERIKCLQWGNQRWTTMVVACTIKELHIYISPFWNI